MNKNKDFIVLVLLIALIGLPANTSASTTLKTIKGNDSIETAIAVAKELNSDTNTYIITTNDTYPDALAGTVLAGKYNAPILLVTKGDNQKVFDYLDSENVNSSTKFFILGGTSAVSQDIENKLKAISKNTIRLGGANRYETDVAINNYLNPTPNTPVIIATGLDYPDALSMGAIGGQLGYPILLINRNGIPQSVATQLKEINPSAVYIAGGTAVVPETIENQIKKLVPASGIERLGGQNRYETSQMIEDFFSNKLSQKVYTTGKDFHNALISAPLASKNKASILLADNITSAQKSTMLNERGYQVGDIVVKATPPEEVINTSNKLTEADIQRLQSYPSNSVSVTFDEMYATDKADCEAFVKAFSLERFNLYPEAQKQWLTSPKLVYRTLLSQYAVRGILRVTYSGSNEFNLTPNVTYQRDAEYRVRNIYRDGRIQLVFDSAYYLNDFKPLK